MSRRVRTLTSPADEAAFAPKDIQTSSWADKATSYIPGEIIAGWVAVSGLVTDIKKIPPDTVLWVLFALFLVGTAYYTYRQTTQPGKPVATGQIIITTVAFAFWVFGLGGPFKNLSFYEPAVGQIVLAIWTLLIAPLLPIKQS